MTARVLDGAAVAREIRDEVGAEVARLHSRGVRPGLGVLLVGDDPASAVYVGGKRRRCEELGIHHEALRLPAQATTSEVAARVNELNANPEIHGVVVQLPLPGQVDAGRVLELVDPAKDVDGFHPENVGRLVRQQQGFVPCTPAGIMELLRRSEIDVAGRRAVVLGRSDIVGKPMALLLLHANATVTVCHSRTLALASVTREAEILVVAIGKAGLVRAEHVRPGAVVVDVGMNRIDEVTKAVELLDDERLARFREIGSALVGDVQHPTVREVASALTPVPGGVGPLTIAMPLKNTVTAAARAASE